MANRTRTKKPETQVQPQSDEWIQRAQEVARNINLEIPAEDEDAEQKLRRFEQEDGE